ncbi:uncharacterized protein LOC120013010 [Tripterygium wilfordii]|uniref:uncharacterized protein LOC120013010 n=1 Tax=Tripterygium wilfordii TaxID=458696 RepID=UPI0018F83028|nr:uncharacterized protein LOC120013010 [Tripterygium wilfordii]
MSQAAALPCFGGVMSSVARRPQQRAKKTKGFGGDRKEPLWSCVKGCGACCKLAKGYSFATPEEIFTDPKDIELYRSLVGADGWCVHYQKNTRTCSIYSDRPYFCRVEPNVFNSLYGIDEQKFNKEACSGCRDTIKAVYGSHSEELDNFNRSIKNSVSAEFGVSAGDATGCEEV